MNDSAQLVVSVGHAGDVALESFDGGFEAAVAFYQQRTLDFVSSIATGEIGVAGAKALFEISQRCVFSQECSVEVGALVESADWNKPASAYSPEDAGTHHDPDQEA